MFKHLFTFICQSSSVDGNDGMLSAYKFFENFNVPETATEQVDNGGVLPINFEIVSGWVMDTAQAKPLTLTVTKEIIKNGENIAKIETNIEVPANLNRFNLRETTNGLPVKGFGAYTLKLSLTADSKVVGTSEYPFNVVAIKQV